VYTPPRARKLQRFCAVRGLLVSVVHLREFYMSADAGASSMRAAKAVNLSAEAATRDSRVVTFSSKHHARVGGASLRVAGGLWWRFVVSRAPWLLASAARPRVSESYISTPSPRVGLVHCALILLT
jgi:hypothetical protein